MLGRKSFRLHVCHVYVDLALDCASRHSGQLPKKAGNA